MDERQRNRSSGVNINWALLTSWPFIVGAFILGLWPVGLFLIFLGADLDSRKKKPHSPTAQGAATVQPQSAATASAAAQTPPPAAKKGTRKAAKTPAKKKKVNTNVAVGFLIAGAILAFVGLMNTINTLDMVVWTGSLRGYFGELWTGLSVLAAGGGLFGTGLFRRRRARRYPRYLAFLGDRRAVSLPEIASAMGLSRRRVVKDLEKMLEDGLLPAGAYLDMGREYYFAGADAVPVEEEKQPEPQPAQTASEEYEAILRNIRQLNDRIADEELSADIDRIEDISRKIFQEVERCPEKKGQISTLLHYYLPTTQKLLDSYATFEAAGVEGSNMTQAKERIEQTMQRVVQGFERQLDQLYSADAMDVESDIRVMESMLNRDGAGMEQDFELRL